MNFKLKPRLGGGERARNTLYTVSASEQDDPRKWSDDREPTSHDSAFRAAVARAVQ